jgi:hypothetical protein
MVFGEVIDCNDAWLSGVAGRHGVSLEDSAALWRAIAAETHATVAGIERAVHPAFAEAQP